MASGLAPPVAGRFAGYVFYKPAEIGGVGKAQLVGNRFHRFAKMHQLAQAFVGHPRFDEGLWAFLQMLATELVQIFRADAELVGIKGH